MAESIAQLKSQLAQLTELHQSGVLSAEQFSDSEARLKQRILDQVLSGGELPVEVSAVSAPQRPWKLIAGLALGVVVLAVAGYAWKGAPELAWNAPAPSGAAASTDGSAANAPHTTNFDAIAAMTDKLAARLKDQPQDSEGWAMLARSYGVLGRRAEALSAFEKAVALRKDDATLLADYADALAVMQDGKIAGKPLQQIERALKLDPKNIKALFLAGTHAFDNKKYQAAIGYWQTAVQAGPADNPFVQQMESALAEARSLAGLPPASPAGANGNASTTAAGAPMAASPSATSISGRVTLSPALQKKVAPDDTVFVFARAAQGSRMPLAILRKQVRDLPFDFTLDDSMAMSPAARLSGAPEVVVGARVSKSGNAMPQPGDLQGVSPPVAVGTQSLKLEIKDTVNP